MNKQRFGGKWTIEKLNILSEYLDFYLLALKNKKFEKVYIDAFAGSGTIVIDEEGNEVDGSVKLALKTKYEFDRYFFIERNKIYAAKLSNIILDDFPQRAEKADVITKDCNDYLPYICREYDWKNRRAVLLLDPYAMDVNWDTLKIIANTKAIDVWYLFPLSAANRLLKRNGEIDLMCKAKLNAIFGDSKWYDEFYKIDPQTNLFGDDKYIKSINIEALKNYICNRLKVIFSKVAENPRILYNTKNSPLFLFCFAVSNNSPSATKLALRGAKHILDYSGR